MTPLGGPNSSGPLELAEQHLDLHRNKGHRPRRQRVGSGATGDVCQGEHRLECHSLTLRSAAPPALHLLGREQGGLDPTRRCEHQDYAEHDQRRRCRRDQYCRWVKARSES